MGWYRFVTKINNMFDGLVFYSSFIPDKNNLFRGIDFLEMMKKKYQNYVIFIGIQTNSINEWSEIIEKYKKEKLNIFYDNCDENLYVNSDVTGFQKSLQLYYNHKNEIKLKNNSAVWFGHSKGATTNLKEYHNWVFMNFWNKKNEIEKKLNEHEYFGCYGTHLSFIPNYNKTNIKNLWIKYCDYNFNYEPLNFMFVNTFYVIKNSLFQNMISNLKPLFFEEKIEGVNGIGDRYFFERDFIHFVDMMGYQPLFEQYSPNMSWMSPNENDFIVNLNNWKNTKL
jgi:hypothetical protein